VTEHKIPRQIIGGRVYHKPKGFPYAYGSTLDAVKRAVRRRKDGIDIDYRVSKDGTGWWCHQANPTKRDGWRDPEGHINDSHALIKLTDAQVSRLQYRGRRILNDEQFLRACKAAGLVPCVEDKTYRGHSVAHWREFKRLADSIGVVPIVMSLPGTASVPGTRKLKAAHDAGLVTMWLWRKGSRVPAFVDLIKSKPRKGIHRVSDRPVSGTTPAPPTTPRPEVPVSKLPADLPDKLRAAGLKVIEHDGWRDRGRPGSFNPVGVLCHHTATRKTSSDSDVVSLLIRGRSDLPGPLCQIGLDRDGRVRLIAAGRANHGGRARASGSVAAGDANSIYIGIEAFNDGVGEPWPSEQMNAYGVLAAVLCKEVTGNSVRTVRGHKETSVTGKIDPRFSMDEFRARVAARLKALGAPTPTPDKPDNHVQKGRALIRLGLAELRKAPASREVVHQRADQIAAILKKGPSS
jgi:hypothetical protein